MTIDDGFGLPDGDGGEAEGGEVLPLRPPPLRPPPKRPPPRPGDRRVTVSGSSSGASDDSRLVTATARQVEVEGHIDRLGSAELRTTLKASEEARRYLTQDLVDAGERRDAEVERVRAEYEAAAEAAQQRHGADARRWRAEFDRLQKEAADLRRDLKDAKKAKKKHKRSVQAAELQIAELREAGESKRAGYALAGTFAAAGVPPLAMGLARVLPDLFAIFRGVVPRAPAAPGAAEEAVLDRAAAIRFASRLFDPTNELAVGVLEDMERLATIDVVEDGQEVVVNEWKRVQRCVWAALRREAEAAPAEYVADAPSVPGGD
jgi:hypothetical protein